MVRMHHSDWSSALWRLKCDRRTEPPVGGTPNRFGFHITPRLHQNPLPRWGLRFQKKMGSTADWPAGGFSDLLCAMNPAVLRQLRTLLTLSRVSHLPTVWSNCLAGWWLGGHGNVSKLPLLFLGVSALFTGGMFLNDAFDADFDRQRRTERPIPSGAI